MTSVLADQHSGQPEFKFEQTLDLYHLISLFVSSLAFILIISYTFHKYNSSIITTNFKGLLTRDTNNIFYFIEVVPPPTKERQELVTFFNLQIKKKARISIDASIVYQWKNHQPYILQQNFNNISAGVYKLLHTKVFVYDSLIIQLKIDVQSDNFLYDSAEIIDLILNEEELYPQSFISLSTIHKNYQFGQNSTYMRITYFAVSLLTLILFIYSIQFFDRFHSISIRFEQYLTLFALVLSILANFPFSHFFNTLTFHFTELFFVGSLNALNVVSFYLFVHKANGQNVHNVIPISILFIFSESFWYITSDSAFLYLFFDNNTFVELFFMISSIIGNVGFVAFFFHAISSSLCSRRAIRKKLFVSYLFAIGALLFVLAINGIDYAFNGFTNFAFSFASDYMAQTFLALLFADLHWPLMFDNEEETAIGVYGDQQQLTTLHDDDDFPQPKDAL